MLVVQVLYALEGSIRGDMLEVVHGLVDDLEMMGIVEVCAELGSEGVSQFLAVYRTLGGLDLRSQFVAVLQQESGTDARMGILFLLDTLAHMDTPGHVVRALHNFPVATRTAVLRAIRGASVGQRGELLHAVAVLNEEPAPGRV